MISSRLAVLVSGGGTNLQAIIDASRAGKMPDTTIAVVISDRENAYALERARLNGIPTVCISRGAEFENQLIAALESFDIRVVALAGFMSILSEAFVRKYADRILNIHPSLLPAFGGKGFYGLKPHEAALNRGVKITGATVHVVNEIPDGGRILRQKAVRVCANDTPETLQKRVMEKAEWVIYPKEINKFCKYKAKESAKG